MEKTITGERIRGLRESVGLTQKQLAVKIGCSHITIQNWESGVYLPKGRELIHLADFFGVTTDWLLGREVPSLGLNECLSFIRDENSVSTLLTINNQANLRLSRLVSG